jgi:hypothetical protein
MLTKRALFPIVDYIIDSIQEKKPGIYFLFEDSINALKGDMAKNAKPIDLHMFSQERQYMLLIMKKG